MKNKNVFLIIISVVVVIVAFAMVKEVIPIINENKSKIEYLMKCKMNLMKLL